MWFRPFSVVADFYLDMLNRKPEERRGIYGQILPQIDTPFTYFDNKTTKIIDENATVIFGEH